MTGTKPGLRERKKQRTRESLEEAAFGLFAERGYDATTVEDIAEEAFVSARTFFRYFKTKDDVFFSHYAERQVEMAELMAARPAGEPVLESLRAALLAYAEHVTQHRDVMLLHGGLLADSPTLSGRTRENQMQIEQLLSQFAAGRFGVDPALDLRPTLLATICTSALTVAINAWIANPDGPSLVTVVEEAFDLLDLGPSLTGAS